MSKLILSLVVLAWSSCVCIAQTYPIGWTGLVNSTITAGNTVTKTGGSNNVWDAGAVSFNTLAPSTNGSLEFVYTTTAANYMVGLSRVNTGASYVNTEYQFYLAGAALSIYELNSSRGAFGALVNGDVLEIARVEFEERSLC